MQKLRKQSKSQRNVEFLMLPSTFVTYVRSNPRMILSSSVAIEPYNPNPKNESSVDGLYFQQKSSLKTPKRLLQSLSHVRRDSINSQSKGAALGNC